MALVAVPVERVAKALGKKRKRPDPAERVKFGVGKAFANRDEHSSIGATVVRRSPSGPGQRGTLHARSGYAAGRTRGVGRREARDESSSPRVTRMIARTPDGKYASHENKLTVVRPERRVSSQPKTSALGIHRKGRGSETRGYVEKSAPSQATGVVMHDSPWGRGNSRFGGAGTRGRKLA